MKQFLLQLCAFLLLATSALAQSTGSLHGRVTDARGQAIPGATVSLRSAAGEKTALSDGNGEYRFANVTGESYELQASARGFALHRQPVTSGDLQNHQLDLTLEVSGISETVSVTAARGERDTLETPEPISVVNQQRLTERNLATISDALRELPGAAVQSGGPVNSKPIIRGLDGARVLVLVDGVRFNNSRQRVDHTGGGEAIEPGLIDISQIESLEVVRGGGSVLYGSDAVGGIMNIITKETARPFDKGWRFGGELNTRLMSNGPGQRGDGTLSISNQRFSLRASQSLEKYSQYSAGAPVPPAFARYFGTGGTGARYVTGDFLRDPRVLGTQLTGCGTALEGRYFLSDKQSLRATYAHRGAFNYGSPNSITRTPFSKLDRGSLTYTGSDFTPWLTQVSATVYSQYLSRNVTQITDTNLPFVAPGTNPLFSYQETIINPNTTGFDTQAVLALPRKNIVTVGSSFFRDRSRDEQVLIQGSRTLPLSADAARNLVGTNLGDEGFNSAFRRANSKPIVPNERYRNFGVFAQDEYQILRRLRLVGGIRFDTFRSNRR